jgi:hypothetical protein
MSQVHTPLADARLVSVPRARRIAVVAGAALLVVGALADVYSVAHHLPYAFGGHGDPDKVGQEWAANGTALGPPLMPLVALALFVPLAAARRWWGGVAEVLLALVSLAVLVGTLGEPSTHTVFQPGSIDVVQILFRAASVVTTGALFVCCCADLQHRFTTRRRPRAAPMDSVTQD